MNIHRNRSISLTLSGGGLCSSRIHARFLWKQQSWTGGGHGITTFRHTHTHTRIPDRTLNLLCVLQMCPRGAAIYCVVMCSLLDDLKTLCRLAAHDMIRQKTTLRARAECANAQHLPRRSAGRSAPKCTRPRLTIAYVCGRAGADSSSLASLAYHRPTFECG